MKQQQKKRWFPLLSSSSGHHVYIIVRRLLLRSQEAPSTATVSAPASLRSSSTRGWKEKGTKRDRRLEKFSNIRFLPKLLLHAGVSMKIELTRQRKEQQVACIFKSGKPQPSPRNKCILWDGGSRPWTLVKKSDAGLLFWLLVFYHVISRIGGVWSAATRRRNGRV